MVFSLTRIRQCPRRTFCPTSSSPFWGSCCQLPEFFGIQSFPQMFVVGENSRPIIEGEPVTGDMYDFRFGEDNAWFTVRSKYEIARSNIAKLLKARGSWNQRRERKQLATTR